MKLMEAGVTAAPLQVHSLTTAPLYVAASHGRADLVQQLLDVGAPCDVADRDGCTPLCLAARQGHAAVVQKLLVSGETWR